MLHADRVTATLNLIGGKEQRTTFPLTLNLDMALDHKRGPFREAVDFKRFSTTAPAMGRRRFLQGQSRSISIWTLLLTASSAVWAFASSSDTRTMSAMAAATS